MIPVWTETTSIQKEFPGLFEDCVFCKKETTTWHENTNSPCCVSCAETHKVSEFTVDWGKTIRAKKRKGTFDREDSVRAN